MTVIEEITNRSISRRAKTHILCICAGGNTRSVTLATLLKFHFGGYDALACSIEKNSDQTLDMLFRWSELILCADKYIFDEVLKAKERFGWTDDAQTILIPIGQDKWGMSMHPELTPIAYRLLEEAGFKRGSRTTDEIVARLIKYEDRRKEPDGPTFHFGY